MRVLVCPTAFKGTLTATAVAGAMRRGVRRAAADAEVRAMPLSDGGPGLLEALSAAGEGRVRTVEGVSAPRGATAPGARVLLLDGGRTAVVESADACGLALLPQDARDPTATHTRGVGDLIHAAAEEAPDAVIVGLGGSATCDGGTGAARRFGYRFLDDHGAALPDGGGPLAELAAIDPDGKETGGRAGTTAVPELLALADVDDPLLGPEGAAATYAPQKGAGPAQVERLEAGLGRLVEVAARDLEADPAGVRTAAERPGAGAAGGLAFGLEVFLGARVVGGTDWVLSRVEFGEALRDADLLVTGEGAYDRTTDRGKVVGRVLRRAREAGVPARLVCGRIDGELPEGVRAEDGGGAEMDADAVAAATARLVRSRT